jgi:hypothetical protein
MPFTNMGGCELICFFAYLLATPQISQKVEKFMRNLLMQFMVRRAEEPEPDLFKPNQWSSSRFAKIHELNQWSGSGFLKRP